MADFDGLDFGEPSGGEEDLVDVRAAEFALGAKRWISWPVAARLKPCPPKD